MGLFFLPLAATLSPGGNIGGWMHPLQVSVEDRGGQTLGGCAPLDMDMAHLAALCHTGVTGEGVGMFLKCGLETVPQDWRNWEGQLLSGAVLGGATVGCIRGRSSSRELCGRGGCFP